MKIYTSYNKYELLNFEEKDSKRFKIEFAATFLNGLEKPTLFLALTPQKVFYVYGEEHIKDFIKNLTDYTPKFENDSLNIRELRGKTLTGILEKDYIHGICLN